MEVKKWQANGRRCYTNLHIIPNIILCKRDNRFSFYYFIAVK